MSSASSVPQSLPPCPFQTGGPLQRTQSAAFVGRRELLRRLYGAIAQGNNVAIESGSMLGKSSLLLHLCRNYEAEVQGAGLTGAELVMVYVNLQDGRYRREEDFYGAIVTELQRSPKVQGNGALVQALQNPAGAGAGWDRVGFGEMLRRWRAVGVKPVLCLDKFEELLEHPDNFPDHFYDNFRSLTQDHVLSVILTTNRNVEQYAKTQRLTSDFFNQVTSCSLGELTEEEADQLARLPWRVGDAQQIQRMQQVWTIEHVKLVRRLGKTHPYWLQVAGCYLWEELVAGQPWVAQKQAAQRRFMAQEQRVRNGASRFQRWPQLLRQILSLFAWIGRLTLRVGQGVSELQEVLVGITVVVVLAAAVVLGASWADVREFLQNLLGG
ncbi:MAG: hypothetical protein ACO34J_09070 [Prochlorothrix sp.]